MRIASILRLGTLALALAAGMTTIAPAFAQTASSTQSQATNSGPYSGAAWHAAKQSALQWGD